MEELIGVSQAQSVFYICESNDRYVGWREIDWNLKITFISTFLMSFSMFLHLYLVICQFMNDLFKIIKGDIFCSYSAD